MRKTSSAAGVEQLRRAQAEAQGLPPPGTAPTRLHGRFATCVVGSITMLCFDWEVNFNQDFADSTAHGDFWDFPVPLKMMWTGRAKGYFTTAGAATATYIYNVSKIGGDPSLITFTGYSTPAATTAIFTGQGYASRGNFSSPMAMVTQEVEIKGYGPPTVGSPA